MMRTRAVLYATLAAVVGTTAACPPAVQVTPPPATAPAAQVALSGASVLIGVGDIATCNSYSAKRTATIVDSVLRADSIAKVEDMVFTLGDNAYTSGSTLQFTQCFAESWGDTSKRIMRKIKPSPGNHEYYSPYADPYYKYFGAAAGVVGKGYYSYDIGKWHAVVLNSEILVNDVFTPAERKAQEDWLAKDLADHKTDCTVAYFHHPRYSSGWHGDNVKISGVWQTMYDANVDLILVGHDHHYERFEPMTSAGVKDTARGIVQILAGTGGENLRGLGRIHPNSAIRITGHSGVIMVTLGAKEWRSAFLDIEGRIWDQAGGKCH